MEKLFFIALMVGILSSSKSNAGGMELELLIKDAKEIEIESITGFDGYILGFKDKERVKKVGFLGFVSEIFESKMSADDSTELPTTTLNEVTTDCKSERKVIIPYKKLEGQCHVFVQQLFIKPEGAKPDLNTITNGQRVAIDFKIFEEAQTEEQQAACEKNKELDCPEWKSVLASNKVSIRNVSEARSTASSSAKKPSKKAKSPK